MGSADSFTHIHGINAVDKMQSFDTVHLHPFVAADLQIPLPFPSLGHVPEPTKVCSAIRNQEAHTMGRADYLSTPTLSE